MRAVVIAGAWPARPQSTSQSIDRRIGMFLSAITQFCSKIDMVHIVPRSVVPQIGDVREIAREQSEYWTRDVSVTLIPRRDKPARQTAWNQYGAGALDAFAQPALYPFTGTELVQQVAKHLDPAPDLIYAQQLHGMLPLLRSGKKLRNVLFDIDNVAHQVLLRDLLQPPLRPGKLASLAQVPALANLERRAATLAALGIVCSELDRQYLKRFRIASNVAVVPNAVPLPSIVPGLTEVPTILFLGACDYTPNALAAERLTSNIFPLIRHIVPDARLMIAGKRSQDLPSAKLQQPGVEHLAFVDDLGVLYAQSRIVCCPITTGGGTRTKLVEAAAYARPMVTTRIAAEGLEFKDGVEILLRDKDKDIANAVIHLLRDDAQCVRLGNAALEKMRQLYDAQKICSEITRLIQQYCMLQ